MPRSEGRTQRSAPAPTPTTPALCSRTPRTCSPFSRPLLGCRARSSASRRCDAKAESSRPPQVWTGSGLSSCSSQGAEGTRRPSLGRSTAGQPDHGPSSEEVSDLYQQVFAAFGVHCHHHRQRRSGPFISRGSQVRSRLDRSHQRFLSRSLALLSLPTDSAPCAPLLPPLTHLLLPAPPHPPAGADSSVVAPSGPVPRAPSVSKRVTGIVSRAPCKEVPAEMGGWDVCRVCSGLPPAFAEHLLGPGSVLGPWMQHEASGPGPMLTEWTLQSGRHRRTSQRAVTSAPE